jgi:hypothetical protein
LASRYVPKSVLPKKQKPRSGIAACSEAGLSLVL